MQNKTKIGVYIDSDETGIIARGFIVESELNGTLMIVEQNLKE
jgi:hypothetical protein